MSWVGKSQSTQKNCTKIDKEETHGHQKRARSTLSKERMLDLWQWCTTSRECSVRLDKGRKSELSQNETLLYLSEEMCHSAFETKGLERDYMSIILSNTTNWCSAVNQCICSNWMHYTIDFLVHNDAFTCNKFSFFFWKGKNMGLFTSEITL